MFFRKPTPPTYGHVINRVAVIIRVKQPYVDWSNRVSGDKETLDDFTTDAVTYLFAVDTFREMAIKKAEAEYVFIFEHCLSLISENPDNWPKQRTLDMFRQWFELEMSDMVVDLENDNGIINAY